MKVLLSDLHLKFLTSHTLGLTGKCPASPALEARSLPAPS